LSSPDSFKILTPTRKYDTVQKQSTPVCKNLFPNSPSLSITPTTKSWVSSLIDLPSPQTKLSLPLPITDKKHIILQDKINNLRRILKRKRALISTLKKKNEKKNILNNFSTILNLIQLTQKPL